MTRNFPRSNTDPSFWEQELLAKEILALLRRAAIAGSVEDIERRYEPDYWNEADATAKVRDRQASIPSRPDALDADDGREGHRTEAEA